MASFVDFVLKTLSEAFSWVKSQVESFIEFLRKKFSAAADNARRFFDNFSEKFKQAFTESKQKLDAALKKVVEIMCSIKSSICSNELLFMDKISLLVKKLSSLIGLMKLLVNKHVKNFMANMKEIEIKTRKRFKSSTLFNCDKFNEVYDVILGFYELLKMVQQPPPQLKVQVAILLKALLIYLKGDIKEKEGLKNLEDQVNNAAMFVYILLKKSATFRKSLIISKSLLKLL